jgi:hypothetical protein
VAVLSRHEDGGRQTGKTWFIGAKRERAGRGIARALYPKSLGFENLRGIDGTPYKARGRGTLGGRKGADTVRGTAMQGKRRTFLVRGLGIFQRTGTSSVRLLWRLERQGISIRPTLQFRKTAARLAPGALSREAERAVTDIIGWRR